jgi:hypothetical protein
VNYIKCERSTEPIRSSGAWGTLKGEHMQEKNELSLSTINEGAVNDLFTEELEKVLRNIHDLNTKADAVREINISIKFKPNKDRLTASTDVKVSSKLSPPNLITGSLFLMFDNNKPKAYANNPHQMNFSDIK